MINLCKTNTIMNHQFILSNNKLCNLFAGVALLGSRRRNIVKPLEQSYGAGQSHFKTKTYDAEVGLVASLWQHLGTVEVAGSPSRGEARCKSTTEIGSLVKH